MGAKPLPSQRDLLEVFDYLPTGDLVWRARENKSWSAKWAGKVVAQNLSHNGYRKVSVGGRFVFAHRVIWKMHYGTEPAQVDHINGQRDDNRIENLRAAISQSQNQWNSRPRGGSSRYKGVYRAKGGKWGSRIKEHGKTRHLGTYDTEHEAALAYDKAAIARHDRFHKTNFTNGAALR